MKLNERELATVLAALRLFQREYQGKDGEYIANCWPEHFTDDKNYLIPPLDDGEIDDLCERINFSNADSQAAPQITNALWDALSEILETPEADGVTLPAELRQQALDAIAAAQRQEEKHDNRFVVLSYYDDEQQTLVDIVESPDADKAKEAIGLIRPYAIPCEALPPEEFIRIGILAQTESPAELAKDLHEVMDDSAPYLEDHTDDPCPCGDPDCNRPWGHQKQEDASENH